MPKLKPETILPTPEEDAAITAAAMSDPDAIPYTDTEWEAVKAHAQARQAAGSRDQGAHHHPPVTRGCASLPGVW